MSDDDRGAPRDDAARDLLGAYAVDAVDELEQRAVERLVERDPDAARELAELRETAAALGAATATPPPPGLRADVLAQVRRTPQVGPPQARAGLPTSGPTPVQPPVAAPGPADAPGSAEWAATLASPPRIAARPRRATTWLAVAAAAVGAAVVPSALAVREAQRSERVEQEALAVTDLLADPAAEVVRASVTGGGTAVGVLTDDRALFTGVGMPDPGEDRDYQLWVVRDGAALPAAVLEADDGRTRAVTDEYRTGDALAVTVEPAGGSEQPTTEPVVVLATDA